MKPPQYQLVAGDGADMALVGTGEADLVLTSPPYFSEATEALLRRPRSLQDDVERVRQEVADYAVSLRPVFIEIARVLRPGGALVLQTKDLRYSGVLVELASLHRDLAEDAGLVLVTRVLWQKVNRRNAQSEAFRRHRAIGSFRADDLEEFLVCAHPGGIATRRTPIDLPDDELAACEVPVWRYPALGRARAHPFQSPPGLIRRFVALYSAPGDLVVDPFAGHGTTLRAAVELGRRAVGYELNQRYAAAAEGYIAGALPAARGGQP